jgi:hypothetical protein
LVVVVTAALGCARSRETTTTAAPSTPSARASVAPAGEELAPAGSARPLADTIGTNGRNTVGPPFTDARLKRALVELGPQSFRFPGGTIAQYWDWRRGWFQTGYYPTLAPVDDSLSTLREVVEATGAAPIYVLNMLTTGGRLATAGEVPALVTDQIQMLEAARAAKLPVRYIELGNEFYLTGEARSADNGPAAGRDYDKRFPTPHDYAREADRWIEAVHAAVPDAKVAVVGAPGASSPRAKQWNDVVLASVRGASAVTLHLYPELGSADARAVVDAPFVEWRRLEEEKLPAIRAHKLEAWITEYNLNDKTVGHRLAATWIHALATAELAVLAVSEPTVTKICRFNVLDDGQPAFGPGSIVEAGGRFSLSPIGEAMAMLAAAAKQATTAQLYQGAAREDGHPLLLALRFAGGPKTELVVLNLGASSAAVHTDELVGRGARYETLSGAPDATAPTRGTGESTGAISLPAHSMTRASAR